MMMIKYCTDAINALYDDFVSDVETFNEWICMMINECAAAQHTCLCNVIFCFGTYNVHILNTYIPTKQFTNAMTA